MDLSLLIAWEWFQWIAIRLALFMGLLTLGPSIGLIVFDLVLYAYRTIFGNVVLLGERKTTVTTESKSITSDGEVLEVQQVVEVVEVDTAQ